MVNRKENRQNSSDIKSKNTSITINSLCKEINLNLLELFSNGIIIEDDKGAILDVNDNYCNLMLYKRNELIGKNVDILTHPDVKNKVNINIKNLLEGEYLKHTEKSIRKDGSTCYVKLKEKSGIRKFITNSTSFNPEY